MREHLSPENAIILGSIVFAACASTIRRAQKMGWHGWIWELGSFIVNTFVGFQAFLIASVYFTDWRMIAFITASCAWVGAKAGDIFVAELIGAAKERLNKL
jgi:hypothetical protein